MSAKKAPAQKKAVKRKKVKLLAGGNPQIAMGDGNAPVAAFLAAVPGWKKDAAKKLDARIMRAVPELKKAVKWNSPLYGISGKGFVIGFHVLTNYLKVSFLFGSALKPLPPVESKDANARYVHITEDEPVDEKQLESWIKQAAKGEGWLASKV